MSTLSKAIEFASRAHGDQYEKDGKTPYILHPLRVMALVQDPTAKIVAVLHDVVEDTSTTPDDLRSAGFAEEVIEAVLSVSRRETESYADFVVRSKANPIGRQVKLADLTDNYNLPRTLVRAASLDKDLARIRRYVLSYKFLTDVLGEADYRAAMEGE